MQQHDPVSRHGQVQNCLVSPRGHLFRFREYRRHTRMCHVSFNRNAGLREGTPAAAGQTYSDGSSADPDWLWRDLRFDPYARRGRRGPAAGPRRQQGKAAQQKAGLAEGPGAAALRQGKLRAAPLWFYCGKTMRRPRPAFRSHRPASTRNCNSCGVLPPLAGTCGSTCQSPWE